MEDLFPMIVRTLAFYFFIVLLYRIMGKREVGELGIIDLIISILMAELAAISIENTDKSILLTLIPLTLLGGLEILLAYISIKSRKFRAVVGGKPSLIICHGRLNYKEMLKQRYSMDDLLLSLRQNEIKNVSDVEYAILEANGRLSIFKYNFFKTDGDYPMPLILDGEVNEKTLEEIGEKRSWLENELKKKSLTIKDVFYAFYNKNKIYFITNKEL